MPNEMKKKFRKPLTAITKACETGKGNLLALAVDAAQKRASLGEISDACEKVSGRYKAVIRSIYGVYSAEAGKEEAFIEAHKLAMNLLKWKVVVHVL